MPSLAIYIPTWNRPNELKVQLTALRHQVNEFQDRVTVIVSDNNSTDLASKEVQEWIKELEWVTLRRRPSNIGANANILCGFLEGSDESYIWVLADDTTVSDNALRNIFGAIASEPDIVALYDDDQRSLPGTLRFSSANVQTVLNEFQWGLISSVVFRFTFVAKDLENGFRFHNSSFPHLGILFSAWKRNGQVQVRWLRTAEVHSGNRGELKSDYSLALVGFPQLFLLLEPRDRRKPLVKWLRKYSAGFAYARATEELSAHTTLTLIRTSGLLGQFWIRFGEFENFLRTSPLGVRAQAFLLNHPALLSKLIPKSRLAYLVSTRKEKNRGGT